MFIYICPGYCIRLFQNLICFFLQIFHQFCNNRFRNWLTYETTDINEKIEKADYKLGEDGNVIEFLNLNKDKNIRVEYIGDRTYKTTMSPTDRQAAAGVYELAQILSAMEQIKKEQEEANLKIGFINKKKERKAQEEITD